MQTDLAAEHPELDITLFGVNEAGHESGNATAIDGIDLGLLQDTVDAAVWTSWAPRYRDVVILDANNEVFAVYNLTDNNLAVADNYDALEQLLIDAATSR